MQILASTSLPWPVSASAPHCAVSVHSGVTTGPGPCHHAVSSFMLIRYPTGNQGVWCVFLCATHARQVGALAEPLDAVAAAELAQRREQHALALAGKPYRPAAPLQPPTSAARASTAQRRS